MKVLVVTGASGGHIFPAVSFIDALGEKHKETDTLLVLPKRGLKPGILLAGCKIKYISTSAMNLNINAANLIAIANFFKGAGESLSIILKFKPDIVVGFGSLDSIPCLLIAWLFRIRTLIHEQNVLPGRANRLLARFVDRVAISFEETRARLKLNRDKIVLTGNPLRRQLKKIDRLKALDFFGFNKDKFTLLVMGGSQGSRHVNSGFLKAVAKLENASMIQVVHLVGSADLEEIKETYKRMKVGAMVFNFFTSMEQAYSVSDLVVSRAGATTISELIFFKLPAIISPYPFAYAHQLENAQVLKDRGCAMVINDEELESERFGFALESIINDQKKLEAMRLGFVGLSMENAADLLADAALSLT